MTTFRSVAMFRRAIGSSEREARGLDGDVKPYFVYFESGEIVQVFFFCFVFLFFNECTLERSTAGKEGLKILCQTDRVRH